MLPGLFFEQTELRQDDGYLRLLASGELLCRISWFYDQPHLVWSTCRQNLGAVLIVRGDRFDLLKEFAASENVQSGDTTFGGCIGVAVAIDYEFCGCYKESREPQQDNTVIKGACIGMQNRGCHRALVFSFACIVSCVCANVTVVTDVFCLMLLEHIMMSSRRQLGSFPCMPIVQYRVQVVNCAMRAVAIRQF